MGPFNSHAVSPEWVEKIHQHPAAPPATHFRLGITGYYGTPANAVDAIADYLSARLQEVRAQGRLPTLITSPTTAPASIDAIGTRVAFQERADILYLTAAEYTGAMKPQELSSPAQRCWFAAKPKFIFATPAEYSRAMGAASEVLIVAGGRETALEDFMNAIRANRRAILLAHPALPAAYDFAKNRPDNAAAYIRESLTAFAQGKKLPYPAAKGFDENFIRAHWPSLSLNVRADDLRAPLGFAAPRVAPAPAKSREPKAFLATPIF